MGMILKRSAFQLENQTNSFLLGNSNSRWTLSISPLNSAAQIWQSIFISGKSSCDYYQVSLIMTIMPCRFISFACDDKKWKS